MRVNTAMEHEPVELIISSTIEELPRVREFAQERLLVLPMSRKENSNIVFCLVEAVVNAINHGNGNDPEKEVVIHMDTAPGKVTITVADQGQGFDPGKIPDPTSPDKLARPTGRGLFFMRQMMSDLEFSFTPTGTIVIMTRQYCG